MNVSAPIVWMVSLCCLYATLGPSMSVRANPAGVSRGDSDSDEVSLVELSALKKQFVDPPMRYRVVLPGAQGQTYLADGIAGGVLLSGAFPSPSREGNVDPVWMDNPKLYDRLRARIHSVTDRGGLLWYYDELGYPSGCAGGKVIAGHPELAAQSLRCRSFETAGNPVEVMPQGKVFHCAAFPVVDGVIRLSGAVTLPIPAAGEFQWQPPGTGTWRLCLFEQVPSEAWKRHDQARQMGNIMDRKAVARFIDLTHRRLETELGELIQSIYLFFTDEPQLNCVEYWGGQGLQNTPPAVQWADELPIAFERKTGYPLIEALPALFNDAGAATGRYRYDFYDVYSDLVAENYWGQIQDWCHRNGTRSSGHMLLEETMLYSVMFNGSMFKNWERMDLPGVDLLCLPRYNTMPSAFGREGVAAKIAASIREFGQKPGVFTESFALCDRGGKKGGELLKAAKGVAAWQFCQGVTHMFTYSLQNTLTKEEYADFADFTARLALLCRRGVPVSDVAVLAPEASVWAYYNPPDGGTYDRYWACNPDVKTIDTVFNETCFTLSSNQRDFEVLTEGMLRTARMADGRLVLGRQRFAFLVLPEVRMIGDAAMTQVEAFAAAGGRVVFTGTPPLLSSERGVDPAMRKRVDALLAAYPGRTLRIPHVRQLSGLITWMAGQVAAPVRWEGRRSVRVMHQLDEGRHIVLVANPSADDARGELIFECGGDASIWDPETGTVTDVKDGRSGPSVELSVPADSARFVVCQRGPAKKAQGAVSVDAAQAAGR